MKNYLIEFIKSPALKVTAEEAAIIATAWVRGDHAVIFNGQVFASHQIATIRPDKEYERDYCQEEKPPRIEDFLSGKKLLHE